MKPTATWICVGLLLFISQAGAQAPGPSRAARPNDGSKRAAGKTTSTAAAPAKPPNSETPVAGRALPGLPVHRVVLYKNGVGYFEHLGKVVGDESVRIDFTSGQLNDVLKSLTILDLSGGRIAGVDYNSEAPMSQLLGALRLPLGEKTSVAEFLDALRGARLEVRGTPPISGRLLSVERKTRVSGGTTLEVEVISLVTDAGEVREVELTPATSVRLMDATLNQEVGKYLTLLASERDQDLRRMAISTEGKGERQIYVSYISEVPVWKTTYRIVLSAKAASKPLLQGWAIVDNTVGEDWNDVQLSLVAGAPQSFVMDLSKPYYATRPSVSLPESVQIVPQTHEATMRAGYSGIAGTLFDPQGAVVPRAQVSLMNEGGQVVAATRTDSEGRYQFADLPGGTFQLEFESGGFEKEKVDGVAVRSGMQTIQDVSMQLGSTATVVEVTAETSRVNSSTSRVSGRGLGSGSSLGGSHGGGVAGGTLGGMTSGMGAGVMAPSASAAMSPGEARQQLEAAALGRDLGDLFEYHVKGPVTIHKNQSALVPIIQANVEAEKVSLWNASLESARPLRALWLTNSSPLTLDGGSFSVLEDETFAGEGLMDPLKAGEKRLLSYAADLGLRVATNVGSYQDLVRRVSIVHGTMILTNDAREQKTYTVRNEDTAARILIIEHLVRPGWTLSAGTPKPEETSPDYYRFRMVVDPKSTATLTVAESMPLSRTIAINTLDTDQTKLLLQQKSISAEIEQALRKIIEQKDRVAALEAEVEKRNTEMTAIYDDQQRLRENLKSLKGSAEERTLTQRYLQRLNDQETRLETIQKEIADFEKKQEQAQAELDEMIEKLSFDATL
ncbi:MAG: carboxypeptidase regulatory-like domain-containing protein [Candidatus Acidiferrales bacterium]